MSIEFGSRFPQYFLKQTISGSSNSTYENTNFAATNNDGSVFVVGEPFGGGNGFRGVRGLASIYTGNSDVGWSLKQVMTGSPNGTMFGISVGMNNDGSTIIINSPSAAGGTNGIRGSISIYTGNPSIGWTLQESIQSPIPGPYSNNGITAINKSGNIIAMGHITNFVYIYIKKNNQWSYANILDISGTLSYPKVSSISTNDDASIITIGCNNDSTNGIDAGAVRIYTGLASGWENGSFPYYAPNLWKLKQTLTGATASEFGTSNAINNNNTIMIGAPYENNDGGQGAGAVYVYTGSKDNGWLFNKKMFAFGGQLYGFNVTLNNDGSIFGYSSSYNNASLYHGNITKDLYNTSQNKPAIGIYQIQAYETSFPCNISHNENGSVVFITGPESNANTARTSYICTQITGAYDIIFSENQNYYEIIFK